jgi:hypothetical protein
VTNVSTTQHSHWLAFPAEVAGPWCRCDRALAQDYGLGRAWIDRGKRGQLVNAQRGHRAGALACGRTVAFAAFGTLVEPGQACLWRGVLPHARRGRRCSLLPNRRRARPRPQRVHRIQPTEGCHRGPTDAVGGIKMCVPRVARGGDSGNASAKARRVGRAIERFDFRDSG